MITNARFLWGIVKCDRTSHLPKMRSLFGNKSKMRSRFLFVSAIAFKT
ncbi:MAG: hypothetical protein WBV73_27510 [Phormidium sp.]